MWKSFPKNKNKYEVLFSNFKITNQIPMRLGAVEILKTKITGWRNSQKIAKLLSSKLSQILLKKKTNEFQRNFQKY